MAVGKSRRGVTLVEMMIVVFIIGLLAAVMVPALNTALRSRENAECGRKLLAAVNAFSLYASETGGYPANQDVAAETTVPAMTNYYFPYLKIDWWGRDTELGGRWDWNVNQDGFKYSVSINAPTKPPSQLEELDRLIDDGNLETGKFRKVNSQYHYIIEE